MVGVHIILYSVKNPSSLRRAAFRQTSLTSRSCLIFYDVIVDVEDEPDEQCRRLAYCGYWCLTSLNIAEMISDSGG